MILTRDIKPAAPWTEAVTMPLVYFHGVDPLNPAGVGPLLPPSHTP